MSAFLLLTSIIIFASLFLYRMTSKFGVPSLVIFMLLGVLFSSFSFLYIPLEVNRVSNICSIALIFIIFYGGFCTKYIKDNSIILKAGLLSSIGTVITAILTALFCYKVLNFDLKVSYLAGALLSSTDAASVFNILRSKKLNLKYNTSSLLEIESGSNDPFSFLLTVIGIKILTGNNTNFTDLSVIFLKQILFGILSGVFCAYFGIFAFKKIKFNLKSSEAIFLSAISLLSFSFADLMSGNGYLSVYITGFILSRTDIRKKSHLLPFFDGIIGFSQIVIFFLLGYLSEIKNFLPVIYCSFFITLFLLISRFISCFLVLMPFRSPLNQITFISLSGLRGAASIVFTIYALSNLKNSNVDIFHIVFLVCFLSVLIKGGYLPFFAKRLNMTCDSIYKK